MKICSLTLLNQHLVIVCSCWLEQWGVGGRDAIWVIQFNVQKQWLRLCVLCIGNERSTLMVLRCLINLSPHSLPQCGVLLCPGLGQVSWILVVPHPTLLWSTNLSPFSPSCFPACLAYLLPNWAALPPFPSSARQIQLILRDSISWGWPWPLYEKDPDPRRTARLLWPGLLQLVKGRPLSILRETMQILVISEWPTSPGWDDMQFGTLPEPSLSDRLVQQLKEQARVLEAEAGHDHSEFSCCFFRPGVKGCWSCSCYSHSWY